MGFGVSDKLTVTIDTQVIFFAYLLNSNLVKKTLLFQNSPRDATWFSPC
jgi:hypothetical protein